MPDAKLTLTALAGMCDYARQLADLLGHEHTLAPAVVLVFPSIRGYIHAREELFRARMTMEPIMARELTNEKHGPDIECFNYRGLEIQLVCHETLMRKNGYAAGATEVGYVFLRGLPPLSPEKS